MHLLVLYYLAQRPYRASFLQLLAIQLKPQYLKHCVTRNFILYFITRQQSPPRKRPQLNSAFTNSSNYIPIISNNLTFSSVQTLPGLFYASLSTISPAIVQFCSIISFIIYLASKPQIVRLIGITQTLISTSGTTSVAERPRTFIHSISYSNLFFTSLSVIYALILPLYNFFIAYILQASRGPTAQSLYTKTQLFYFKVSSWLAALPIQIIILYTSIGL